MLNSPDSEELSIAKVLAQAAARSEETRLNSSHTVISYAVFCLKKKEHTSVLQSHSEIVCRHLLREQHENEPHVIERSHASHTMPRYQTAHTSARTTVLDLRLSTIIVHVIE